MTSHDDAPRGPRRPPRRGDGAGPAGPGPAGPSGAGPRRPPRPRGRAPERPASSPPREARRPTSPPREGRPKGRGAPAAARPARLGEPDPSRHVGTPRTGARSDPGLGGLVPPGRAAGAVRGLAEASRAEQRRINVRRREVQRRRLVVGAGVLAVVVLVLSFCSSMGDDDPSTTATKGGNGSGDGTSGSGAGTSGGTAASARTGLAPSSSYDGWVDPKSSGKPWSTKIVGQLTFRGNPTRTYYGLGPVPKDPKIQWRYPSSGGMCGSSPVGAQPKTWCGTGWTGQPSVWKEGGRTWVAFGAYDKNVHFLDAKDGEQITDDFPIGDIVKGSVTRDPDGFPLLYSGSRADFHVIGLAEPGGAPKDLWSMTATDVSPRLWNDDWDGSSLVIDDYLFEGGENSQFHIVKLNRKKGADGSVTVDPEIVFHAPGWDDELLSELASSGRGKDVSIENSVAISGNTVYFSNSGGLLQGWDISGLKDGKEPTRTFRFWTGDDTDASVVIDSKGFLYVAQERERSTTFDTSDENGQLMKIDPRKPEDPVVWKVNDPGGMWATPALHDGVVFSPTDGGNIYGVDQQTGKVLWTKKLPGPTWSSPVIVDDVWIQGDCAGNVRAFDVKDPRKEPKELWSVSVEGCVESTPTVFDGQVFVGARGGAFYAIGDS
jgi:hypothetical protein